MTNVLLAGGWAAGRIVVVADNATTIAVSVPDYYVGPPHPETTHTYAPTGEDSTSGYPIWAVVL